jgi:polysaccharide export outer membrane protein
VKLVLHVLSAALGAVSVSAAAQTMKDPGSTSAAPTGLSKSIRLAAQTPQSPTATGVVSPTSQSAAASETRPDPLPIPAAHPGDYVVNAGDQLEIYVWGEERLQRTLRVLPDGSFSFPLIGRLTAAGKTLPQIETYVSNGLQSQYRGRVPQVTVSVTAPTGLQFAVAGRVKTPGTFTPGRYVNLLEALTLAGGPDEFANLDNVVIVRKTPVGLVSIRARMGGVFKGSIPAGAIGQNVIPAIESGDTVIVP